MKKAFSAVVVGLMFTHSVRAITVAAVGDLMMGTDYPNGSHVVERDFFQLVRPILKKSDIRFGNFEGTLYDGPVQADGKAGGTNRYLFRTPTAMVSHLKNAGFNAVSLANNHAKDFGRAGLESTKKTLAGAGIKYSSKDGEVARLQIDGQPVAIVATDFYPGRRSMTSPDSTYAEITALKRQGNIVIVSAHAGGEGFGAEHTYNRNEIFLGENRGNSIAFARRAIDSGADLVLMSGPHVPRGLEVHRGHLIAYSLGNFLTEQGISIGGNAGLAPLLEVELDRNGIFRSGKITSFQQVRGKPVSIDPNRRAFQLMYQVSTSDFPDSKPNFAADGSISPNGSVRLP